MTHLLGLLLQQAYVVSKYKKNKVHAATYTLLHCDRDILLVMLSHKIAFQFLKICAHSDADLLAFHELLQWQRNLYVAA